MAKKIQIQNQSPDKNFGETTVCSYESSGVWVAVTAQTSGCVCLGLCCTSPLVARAHTGAKRYWETKLRNRGVSCGYRRRVGPGTIVFRAPPVVGVLWRCPTLPHPPRCSTIGACGLSFQVRNGCWAFPRGYDHHKWFNQYSLYAPSVFACGGLCWL